MTHPRTQRVVTHYGDRPAEDRAVILRSVRVGTSTAFIVALVDGRDRVVDWSGVSIWGSRQLARQAGNRLVRRLGGVAEPPIPYVKK